MDDDVTHQDLGDRWDAYLEAYASPDPSERMASLGRSVADDVVFTNPGGEGSTRDGPNAHIEDFQAKMPGMRFVTDEVHAHHGELLAVWGMQGPNGVRVATGHNFVQVDRDGRFRYMAGFFGRS